MHRDLKCGSSLLQVAASWTLGHISLRFGCFFCGFECGCFLLLRIRNFDVLSRPKRSCKTDEKHMCL